MNSCLAKSFLFGESEPREANRKGARMAKAGGMADLERLVFVAVFRLGKSAYGMTVRKEIAKRTQRDVSLGSVYAALDRLESKKYIKSVQGDGVDSSHAGFGRRYYTPEPLGFRSFDRSKAELEDMLQGLEWERRS